MGLVHIFGPGRSRLAPQKNAACRRQSQDARGRRSVLIWIGVGMAVAVCFDGGMFEVEPKAEFAKKAVQAAILE
jgi:hypothetical protein